MKELIFLFISLSQFSVAQQLSIVDSQVKTSVSFFTDVQKREACGADKSKSYCPTVMNFLMEEDKSDSTFGLFKSVYPTCVKYIKSDDQSKAFASAKDLASHYEKYQGASLGPVVHSQIRRCITKDDQKSKEAIAKYYYNFNRIEKSQQSAMEEMASIDMLLGEEMMKDFDCSKMTFESVKSKCTELKKNCAKDPKGLDGLAEHTKEAKKEIAELEAHKKSLESELQKAARAKVGATTNYELPAAKKIKDQMAALDMAISLVKSRHAWMNGDQYQKLIKNGKSETEAIKAQLQENKKALKMAYAHSEIAQMCMSGVVMRGCSTDNVRKYINQTPIPPDIMDIRQGDTKEKALAGQEYMRFQQCVHDGTTDRLDSSSTFNHAFFDAGLGVATLGLGLLYTAPKALVSARAVMIAKHARTADQAFNGTYFGASLTKATAECASGGKTTIEQKAPEKNSCSASNAYKGSAALTEYDNCVSGLLWAALDGAPFTGGVVQKWAQARDNMKKANEAADRALAGKSQSEVLQASGKINDRTDGGAGRISYAENLLGRKLSKEEQEWVLQAHNKRSDVAYGEHSTDDLRDKLKGRPKSISPEETRKLMKGGALGSEGGKNYKLLADDSTSLSGLRDQEIGQIGGFAGMDRIKQNASSDFWTLREIKRSQTSMRPGSHDFDPKAYYDSIYSEYYSLKTLDEAVKKRNAVGPMGSDGLDDIKLLMNPELRGIAGKADRIMFTDYQSSLIIAAERAQKARDEAIALARQKGATDADIEKLKTWMDKYEVALDRTRRVDVAQHARDEYKKMESQISAFIKEEKELPKSAWDNMVRHFANMQLSPTHKERAEKVLSELCKRRTGWKPHPGYVGNLNIACD